MYPKLTVRLTTRWPQTWIAAIGPILTPVSTPVLTLNLLMTVLFSCQKAPVDAADQKIAVLQENASGRAVPSVKAIVHRKRADLLRNTLYKALDLPDRRGLCLELGKYPCADTVHRVALGRMDAYNNSQYQHPQDLSITSPMALERLVLSACSQRANLDFALLNKDNVIESNAVIFKGLKLTKDLRLTQGEAMDQAITRLYQRGLTRSPTPFELETLKGPLIERIFRENPNGSAINWMRLSCFIVFTSLEGAFY